jgi:hypothetical protein
VSDNEAEHSYSGISKAIIGAYDAGVSKAEIAKLAGITREELDRFLRSAWWPGREKED